MNNPADRMRPPPRPDLTLLRERAQEARDLLAPGGVFATTFLELHQRYHAELATAGYNQGAITMIAAKIQVLDDIASQIRKAMTDYSVEARKQGPRLG